MWNSNTTHEQTSPHKFLNDNNCINLLTSNAGEKGLLGMRFLLSASAFSNSCIGEDWVLTGPLFLFSLSSLEGEPHILQDGDIFNKIKHLST